MDYSHRELGRLIDLLQAEADGRPTDRAETVRLARRLAALYPEITGSMEQILGRAAPVAASAACRIPVPEHEWA